jgi:hypothetical protein
MLFVVFVLGFGLEFVYSFYGSNPRESFYKSIWILTLWLLWGGYIFTVKQRKVNLSYFLLGIFMLDYVGILVMFTNDGKFYLPLVSVIGILAMICLAQDILGMCGENRSKLKEKAEDELNKK